MRSRLSLVAAGELPEHLVADTEHALAHVGWLGVRRRPAVDADIHALHLDGVVPPVTMAHAGHDHVALLAELCRGWAALGVACALLEGDPVVLPHDGDPAIAAARLLQCLAPAPGGADFRGGLAARFDAVAADPVDAVGLPPLARDLVDAVGGVAAAVHLAGTLLGLRSGTMGAPHFPRQGDIDGGVHALPDPAPRPGARRGDRLPPL